MRKIYFYKCKNGNITAEKDFNGLWTIFQNTKKVFGNGYEKKRLIDSLSYSQVLQARKEIKASL